LLALNLKKYAMGHLKDFVTELKKRDYNHKPIYISQKEVSYPAINGKASCFMGR